MNDANLGGVNLSDWGLRHKSFIYFLMIMCLVAGARHIVFARGRRLRFDEGYRREGTRRRGIHQALRTKPDSLHATSLFLDRGHRCTFCHIGVGRD